MRIIAIRAVATAVLLTLVAVGTAYASTVQVPEPSSLALLLAGGGAVAGRAAWKAWGRGRKS